MSQKNNLIIANSVVEYLRQNSIEHDQYLELIGFKYSSDRLNVSRQLAKQVTEIFGNSFIYGMFPDSILDISSIIDVVPQHLKKITTIEEFKSIVDWIKINKTIHLDSLDLIQNDLISKYTTLSGYCLVSVSKIFGAEFIGYDEEKMKLIGQISNLNEQIAQFKKENTKLQEKSTELQNRLETQDAVLNNRVSLSWS